MHFRIFLRLLYSNVLFTLASANEEIQKPNPSLEIKTNTKLTFSLLFLFLFADFVINSRTKKNQSAANEFNWLHTLI